MDGDFDLDLFVGGLFNDPVKIYRNCGDCSFDDVAARSGLDNLTTPHTIAGSFGDYDLDGALDLFLTHWGSVPHYAATGESARLDERPVRREFHDALGQHERGIRQKLPARAALRPSSMSCASNGRRCCRGRRSRPRRCARLSRPAR